MKRSFASSIGSTKAQQPQKSRRFKHVEGNWPCTVSIAFGSAEDASDGLSDDDSEDERSTLYDSVEALATSASPMLTSTFPDTAIFPSDRPLHVSLSHTFVLRHHQISPFLKALKKELSTSVAYQLVLTNAIVQYTNQNKTRAFYALLAQGGSEATRVLIQHVNTVLLRMGQPVYHEHPDIHVSIGWSPMSGREGSGNGTAVLGVGKVGGTEKAGKADASRGEKKVVATDAGSAAKGNAVVVPPPATLEVAIRVTTITCKIGNKVERIQLQEL